MKRKSRSPLWLFTTSLTLAAVGVACLHFGLRCSPFRKPVATPPLTPVALEPARLSAMTDKSGPRLLLDAQSLARLRESARRRTPAFLATLARADEAVNEPLTSGYQGFGWADALANTALIWHATGEPRYAAAALRYARALLDDRGHLGDGQGGALVIRHDSGYGIRTFGAYTALGYDWLRSAPGMDAALRARMRSRLRQWLAWYRSDGYLHDEPLANYYWGYLTTLSFAGLAVAGDAPEGKQWLTSAEREWSERVLPSFGQRLRGGGWPEGAQYGEYTTLEVALVARAFRAAGVDLARKLPWLGEAVTFHAHALLPDGKTVYDGGTWTAHPAKASGLAVAGLSLALDGVDDAHAAQARWLQAHALPPLTRRQAWVGLLADRPGAAESSPRDPAKLSLHASGQGLTFARSNWSPGAVWLAFQAGPPLARDHQHADQGHFELARGADLLLVDGGGPEGSATINHNTLLVDDGGKIMNYTPNQGVWGEKVKTTSFYDDGHALLLTGEIGDAYSPKCALQGCSQRAVERLTRSLVFVRPSLLVIDDEVRISSPDFGVTWAAHLTRPPELRGGQASAVIGGSRVDLATLEPAQATHAALREPTPSGAGSHRLDQPWGPMWRLEVQSPRGARERRFLHAITAAAADAPAPQATRLQGPGLRGARVQSTELSAVVLFADSEPTQRARPYEVALGGSADSVVVAGLAPGSRYHVTLDHSACAVQLEPSGADDASAVNPGGFLRTSAACEEK